MSSTTAIHANDTTDHREAGREQLQDAPAQRSGRAHEDASAIAGHDEIGGERLGVEREADEHARSRCSVRQRPVSHAAQRRGRRRARAAGSAAGRRRCRARRRRTTGTRRARARRRTRRRRRGAARGSQYSSATASTPAIASGSSRLSGEKPNSFALAACTHSASGGLSTVTSPPGSNDANRKLCSERSIDLTPAE